MYADLTLSAAQHTFKTQLTHLKVSEYILNNVHEFGNNTTQISTKADKLMFHFTLSRPSMSRGVAPGQVRGQYARISEEDELRLIRVHEADEDFLYLAQHLGINPNTARGIVRRGEEGIGVQRGGVRDSVVVVTPLVIQRLVALVEGNPVFTAEVLHAHQVQC